MSNLIWQEAEYETKLYDTAQHDKLICWIWFGPPNRLSMRTNYNQDYNFDWYLVGTSDDIDELKAVAEAIYAMERT